MATSGFFSLKFRLILRERNGVKIHFAKIAGRQIFSHCFFQWINPIRIPDISISLLNLQRYYKSKVVPPFLSSIFPSIPSCIPSSIPPSTSPLSLSVLILPSIPSCAFLCLSLNPSLFAVRYQSLYPSLPLSLNPYASLHSRWVKNYSYGFMKNLKIAHFIHTNCKRCLVLLFLNLKFESFISIIDCFFANWHDKPVFNMPIADYLYIQGLSNHIIICFYTKCHSLIQKQCVTKINR